MLKGAGSGTREGTPDRLKRTSGLKTTSYIIGAQMGKSSPQISTPGQAEKSMQEGQEIRKRTAPPRVCSKPQAHDHLC